MQLAVAFRQADARGPQTPQNSTELSASDSQLGSLTFAETNQKPAAWYSDISLLCKELRGE